ncbi:MAG: hypothetical protein ACM31P_04565 [Actinomycetota bacterium]
MVTLRDLRRWTRSWLKLSFLSLGLAGRFPTANPFAETRRSDTLFILGSGTSINSLTSENWDEIRRHDSVGFNAWLLHDFVPQWYVFEPFKPLEATAFIGHNLGVRAEDYRNTRILLKDAERHRLGSLRKVIGMLPPQLHRNVWVSWDWESSSDNVNGFREELRSFERKGIFAGSRYPALRKRATIFFLCGLAVRAGYKKIVLCGVDLTDSGYFYYSYADQLKARGFDVGEIFPANVPHKTDTPEFGVITISRALDILTAEVLQPRGIELAVGFKSSKLYPTFPSHFE